VREKGKERGTIVCVGLGKWSEEGGNTVELKSIPLLGKFKRTSGLFRHDGPTFKEVAY
jgi:hypothetical protein